MYGRLSERPPSAKNVPNIRDPHAAKGVVDLPQEGLRGDCTEHLRR